MLDRGKVHHQENKIIENIILYNRKYLKINFYYHYISDTCPEFGDTV